MSLQSSTQAELLDFAKNLAYRAGDTMRQYFKADSLKVQTKTNRTPVTEADKAINRLVIAAVNERFPAHGVLGEEASVRTDTAELWVCDPIDGTRSFILGEPVAMFSLAFVVNGRPELAVVYDPWQDWLFRAQLGQGAFRNDQRLQVSHGLMAGGVVVSSGSWQEISKRRLFYDALQSRNAQLCFLGGGIFKACLVASGKAEGYVFPGRSAHDVAAVKLIVEEAGGRVTDLDGNEQRYDGPIRGAIISNGIVHDDLVTITAQFGVEEFLGY